MNSLRLEIKKKMFSLSYSSDVINKSLTRIFKSVRCEL